ncbi:MAG TPA: MerR family transcriptional regulator [Dermatophilaceae bacterium]|nr:MerR family transcriptional regulator [Dermatophilaceae bacterium]
MTATSRENGALTVGRVAAELGVTVRTLHHYDELGLVAPSGRTAAGYRLYTREDLARLATVVTYRRLGLPLEEVAALLRGDGTPTEHLLRQRDAVRTRLGELTELARAIDRALEASMNDRPATTAELRELFGTGYSEEYRAEAQERWGDTDAWRQSQARTSRYTRADWEEVRAEGERATRALLDAKRAGLPPDSEAAIEAAEAHRMHIHTRFYDCSPQFHESLGRMYVDDPRFTAQYDDGYAEPGLAAYVRDAIAANAGRRHG